MSCHRSTKTHFFWFDFIWVFFVNLFLPPQEICHVCMGMRVKENFICGHVCCYFVLVNIRFYLFFNFSFTMEKIGLIYIKVKKSILNYKIE